MGCACIVCAAFRGAVLLPVSQHGEKSYDNRCCFAALTLAYMVRCSQKTASVVRACCTIHDSLLVRHLASQDALQLHGLTGFNTFSSSWPHLYCCGLLGCIAAAWPHRLQHFIIIMASFTSLWPPRMHCSCMASQASTLCCQVLHALPARGKELPLQQSYCPQGPLMGWFRFRDLAWVSQKRTHLLGKELPPKRERMPSERPVAGRGELAAGVQ
eukprot:1147635-Pelagomonas_calceolata.AAC.15